MEEDTVLHLGLFALRFTSWNFLSSLLYGRGCWPLLAGFPWVWPVAMHWPEVWGGWRLYYFRALASIRHVCPGSSFYRETPAPDCGNTRDSLWPWGALVSFWLWLIFESPRSSLFGFPALHLLCIQFHTINSLCFKYSEKFLFFWMKQKLQEVK